MQPVCRAIAPSDLLAADRTILQLLAVLLQAGEASSSSDDEGDAASEDDEEFGMSDEDDRPKKKAKKAATKKVGLKDALQVVSLLLTAVSIVAAPLQVSLPLLAVYCMHQGQMMTAPHFYLLDTLEALYKTELQYYVDDTIHCLAGFNQGCFQTPCINRQCSTT